MNDIIFLVSGNGGNLKFVHRAIAHFRMNLKVSAVIADRECAAIEFASAENIPCSVVEYSRSRPEELNALINKADPAIVITNIHKILSPSTIVAQHKYVNLHYSLLPAYKGLIGMDTVSEARKLKCRFIGASTHDVIAEVDSGTILQQGLFRVDFSGDEFDIHNRMFRTGAIILFNTILDIAAVPCDMFDSQFLAQESILLSDDLLFDLDTLVSEGIFEN